MKGGKWEKWLGEIYLGIREEGKPRGLRKRGDK